MSLQIFPSLPGLAFPVKRTPMWKTRVQQAISGKETRLADWSFPRWQWEMAYDHLLQGTSGGATRTDFAQLAAFFNARQGMFDSFLFQDADDNAVSAQPLGVGDGATSSFQLVRAFGGFVEPVLAPNAVSAVRLAGVSIPDGGLTAPAAPSLSSVASGALAGATYFAKSTYVTNSGETLSSAESSLAVAANHVVGVASPAAATGAIGWNSYLGTSSGAETKQNATPIAIGTAFQEPNTGLIVGANLPGQNTTGWAVSAWGTPSPGLLTFGGAVAAGIAIAGDFSYYFPCRFVDDTMDFEKFMVALYSAKSVKFLSLKSA